MSCKINFFTEEISFVYKDRNKTRIWLNDVLKEEVKPGGYINLIFCSDEYLLILNERYLKHSTLTDILTFPNTDKENDVSGDIFISIDRVIENSRLFDQSFEKELRRIIVHGVLHLIGYSDKNRRDKLEMTRKEDHYLEKLLNI